MRDGVADKKTDHLDTVSSPPQTTMNENNFFDLTVDDEVVITETLEDRLLTLPDLDVWAEINGVPMELLMDHLHRPWNAAADVILAEPFDAEVDRFTVRELLWIKAHGLSLPLWAPNALCPITRKPLGKGDHRLDHLVFHECCMHSSTQQLKLQAFHTEAFYQWIQMCAQKNCQTTCPTCRGRVIPYRGRILYSVDDNEE